MSISAQVYLGIKCTETVTTGLDLQDGSTTAVTQLGIANQPSGAVTLSASSPATKVFSDQRGLTAGTDTIDLTSLTGIAGTALTFNGLKVQAIAVQAAGGNTSTITIAPDETNGYQLFGDADGQITLAPGCSAAFYLPESLGDVGSSAKRITVTSSDTDAIYKIELIAG